MAKREKKTGKPSGFEEAPQKGLSGKPLSGSVSAWVDEITSDAIDDHKNAQEGAASDFDDHFDPSKFEKAYEKKARDEEMRKIRSDAGKHRKKAEKAKDRSPKNHKTARGTSIGGAATPSQRAAGGLNPVAGLDVSLEDAQKLESTSGATATVEALTRLITDGNPLVKNGVEWVPHRPERPAKSEGGISIRMTTEFKPSGDQPTAIADLVEGVTGLSYADALAQVADTLGLEEETIKARLERAGRTHADQPHSGDASVSASSANKDQTQVLLGVTGSGKTFTMAKVIEETQRPALILAPNKTLAAQLYGEMKSFFPDNAVEYFVSYYDYYQPEAYVPRSDTYIEKESSVNEQIDRMRHAATRSLLERDDVIMVASVSCIYGIGSVETYTAMTFEMKVGDQLNQRALLADLVAQQYKRNEMAFVRGSFRVRGDTIEIFPAHLEDAAWRVSLWGDEIESITEFDPLTGKKTGDLQSVKIYANSHYVTPRPTLNQAIKSIKSELVARLDELNHAGRLLEAQRLEQRTRFDLEMMEATGACAGIENYSRYLTGRNPGEPPPTLFEYIPDNAIVFIDESHVTVPQIGGMYRGDFRRKATLAEYGFRLPSCMDNRPLRFEEWDLMRPQTVAVSATPSSWELDQSGGVFAEQIIRPTGLVDPPVEVRPARTQVDDVLGEIQTTTAAGYRTLVTVLTKKMAEDLTEYLHEAGVRVRYMHSDIDTLERIEILRDLRLGTFDVLVGINLLREGLDIPECAFVAILDADKEGFLRSETSLVQTIGRAARNVDGRVVLYADNITGSMDRAMAETNRRRDKQLQWNAENGITPESVKKNIGDILGSVYEGDHVTPDIGVSAGLTDDDGHLVSDNLAAHIQHLETQMRDAAADLDFETAARLRDEVKRLRETELAIADDPLARNIGVENTQESRKRAAQGKPAKATGESANLFRKNTLDEMTVGRTEKPAAPDGWKQPRQSYGEEMRNDRGTNSAYGTPLSDSSDKKPPPSVAAKDNAADNPITPIKRHKIGIGSYEDPAPRGKKRKKKTGRPGS